MHDLVSFNHEILAASKIYLPAVSSATFYGRGIFTTIAIYNAAPFQWESHWNRLTENAKIVGIDISEFSENSIKGSLSEIINHNNLKKGRARLTFFDETSKGIWNLENERHIEFLIMTADFRSHSKNLRLTISPHDVNSKSLLNNVKSCNYLEKILILEKAQKDNFDEALRVNEKGEVVSATMANVFWTRDGEIFTPPLETGALQGTTRELLLRNFQVTERRAMLDELRIADEMFLTSAGIGIAKVERLENRVFEQSKVFTEIESFFNELSTDNNKK